LAADDKGKAIMVSTFMIC